MLVTTKVEKGRKSKIKPEKTHRAVKAVLYHLNGTVSEIVLILPIYSFWSESMEDGNRMMREYVYGLTRTWIAISHFETVMGSVLSDGTFRPACGPMNHEIPLGKVFLEGESGKWVSPEDHPCHPLNTKKRGGTSCA
jgi:hypothetical protein